MVYLVIAFKVGVTTLFNFNVAVLESIDVSDSSISLKRFECLNTLSNFWRLFVLKDSTVVSTRALISDFDLSVNVELYLAVTHKTKNKISASTISGTIDATLYFFKLVIMEFLVVVVRAVPVFGLIAI